MERMRSAATCIASLSKTGKTTPEEVGRKHGHTFIQFDKLSELEMDAAVMMAKAVLAAELKGGAGR